eukprot:1971805-Rhodomonas_salina.1
MKLPYLSRVCTYTLNVLPVFASRNSPYEYVRAVSASCASTLRLNGLPTPTTPFTEIDTLY